MPDDQSLTNPMKDSTTEPPRVASLESLLQYEDGEFVDQAYRTLLRRDPDGDGRNFYINRLRAGTSRLQILKEMHNSPEARLIAPMVPGLTSAIVLQRLSSLPVLGVPFRSAIKRQEDRAAVAQLRNLHQRANSQLTELGRRISRLEQKIKPLASNENASENDTFPSVLEENLSIDEEMPEAAIEQFQSLIAESLESRLLRPRQS